MLRNSKNGAKPIDARSSCIDDDGDDLYCDKDHHHHRHHLADLGYISRKMSVAVAVECKALQEDCTTNKHLIKLAAR